MIKVGVVGARGRMGQQVCATVEGETDLELVAQVDEGDSLEALLGSDVVVEFTHPGVVMENLKWCVEHGLDVAVGTSGFGDDRLTQVRSWTDKAPGVRVLIVPNFSVGAVLMMRFAAQAARFFESAEVIDLHNEKKVDAPSGKALRTGGEINEARDKCGSTRRGCDQAGGAGGAAREARRGCAGTAVRWWRTRRCLRRHGETLTIRHDSLDRESFMPGVLLAVRGLASLPAGLTVGIEPLLGLG